jgi:hypothetical protein
MTSEISNHIERLKESFLLAAASGGRSNECQSLLELGAEIDYANDDTNKDTPLLAACRNGHRAVVSLLLAHGANPLLRDGENNTVLHLSLGDEAMASLFSPNAAALFVATNNDGKTAIDLAVERGFSSFAEHLNLLCQTDINSSDNDTYHSSQSSSDEPQIFSSLATDDDSYDASDTSSKYEVNVSNDFADSLDIATDDAPLRDEENNNSTSQLQVELYQAKYALSAVMKERDDLKAELSKIPPLFREDDSLALEHKSLQELQAYERQLKNALERIERAKQNLEEEKLCVVCRENPKEVLMMPCRHLCVCKDCGHRVELTRCPLCREVIAERLTVFS